MPKAIDKFEGDFRFLSNFFPAEIEFKGETYGSLEHAYQASKTHNKKERETIRLAATPGQAKRLGGSVTLRKDWDQINLIIMYGLLWRKFRISPLREALLATKRARLIEGNTWGDTFWGVCDGDGENWLGHLLMLIRSRLKRDERRRKSWARIAPNDPF